MSIVKKFVVIVSVAFPLFVSCCMPGKHSPLRLAERRERALRRGFISPCSSTDFRHIRVPAAVASRTRSVAISLGHHHRHVELASVPTPFARAATRAVQARIAPREFKRAMKAHDVANLAKHSWSVKAKAGATDGSSPASGASAAVFSDVATQHDASLHLDHVDPVAGAGRTSKDRRGAGLLLTKLPYKDPWAAVTMDCEEVSGSPVRRTLCLMDLLPVPCLVLPAAPRSLWQPRNGVDVPDCWEDWIEDSRVRSVECQTCVSSELQASVSGDLHALQLRVAQALDSLEKRVADHDKLLDELVSGKDLKPRIQKLESDQAQRQ